MSGIRGWNRLRLHHRITIPFAVIAFIVTTIVAVVAISLIRGTLERRVLTQVRSTAVVIGRSDFALNTLILRTVKEITGSDIITATTAGQIVASTLPTAETSAVFASVGGASAIAAAVRMPYGEPTVQRRSCGEVPCYIAVSPVVARPDAAVAVVVRTSEVRIATAAIARALVASTALALVVMVVVGQVVARRVTTPIDRLVEFTRGAAPGTSRQRAQSGEDEVGRLAAAFNDMLDRLERTQEALVNSEKLAIAGLLAARVAHDIRNPLSSIKMQTQLLLARAKDEAERELSAAVLHDVDQVESVIRGLLELARPGELHLANANVNDVISQLLRRLAPQFAHRKLNVITDFGASIPSVRLDASRFEQAMLNVVLNAADAMAVGGTLQISTQLQRGGSNVIIEVCDDGAGIDPSVVDRVFDPFVSTKRDGVGLGLVNTKAIIERHGGTVVLERRSPHGTIARMTLPIPGATAMPSAV